jgi:hypothetical protein
MADRASFSDVGQKQSALSLHPAPSPAPPPPFSGCRVSNPIGFYKRTKQHFIAIFRPTSRPMLHKRVVTFTSSHKDVRRNKCSYKVIIVYKSGANNPPPPFLVSHIPSGSQNLCVKKNKNTEEERSCTANSK